MKALPAITSFHKKLFKPDGYSILTKVISGVVDSQRNEKLFPNPLADYLLRTRWERSFPKPEIKNS